MKSNTDDGIKGLKFFFSFIAFLINVEDNSIIGALILVILTWDSKGEFSFPLYILG